MDFFHASDSVDYLLSQQPSFLCECGLFVCALVCSDLSGPLSYNSPKEPQGVESGGKLWRDGPNWGSLCWIPAVRGLYLLCEGHGALLLDWLHLFLMLHIFSLVPQNKIKSGVLTLTRGMNWSDVAVRFLLVKVDFVSRDVKSLKLGPELHKLIV